jgi:hypothetical protein
MSKKEFQKKFMHPTKRKLVDMVFTGKYDKNTAISNRKTEIIDRNVGDEWADENGNLWVQKDGYRIKKSKNSDVFSNVRKTLDTKYKCKNVDCSKVKYGHTDKELIKETGYCSDCLAEQETIIRLGGDWESYSKFRLFHRIYKDGLQILDNLNQALDSVDDVEETVNANGNVQKWEFEGKKDKLRQDILKDIDDVKFKLNETIEGRNKLIPNLQNKNYKIVDELLENIGLVQLPTEQPQ